MAKLIKNDFKPLIETWDDPGDYPSGAGGGPLPSYDYIAGMDGVAVYEISFAEFNQLQANPVEYIEQELDPKLPDGILQVIEWEYNAVWRDAINRVVNGLVGPKTGTVTIWSGLVEVDDNRFNHRDWYAD